ncbi:hypothetical protein TI39_contig4434g00002 [Zymoseptoria brevis]|uniref:Uncharacterized protein n=1 Tax=Zymoseptoria brevis TaxID=1047168 RepID=A0A0F4G6Q0_9PEZI|nr:hypothetical protein TI39_contig4434g00002 [Zymoseptoria brevis]
MQRQKIEEATIREYCEVSTRSAPTDHGLRDSIEESDSELVLEPLEHKPSAKRKTSRLVDSVHLQKQRKVSNISWGGKDVIELSDDVSSESFGISSSREQEDVIQMDHCLQIDDLGDEGTEHRECVSQGRTVSSPPLRLSVTPDRAIHNSDLTQAMGLQADFTDEQHVADGIHHPSSPFRASVTPERFDSTPHRGQQSTARGEENDVVEADFNNDHSWQPAS